jgi:hypothetical protein
MGTFPQGDISEVTMSKTDKTTLACTEREKEGKVTLKDVRLWV